ncbi:hypothetical protein QE369_001960 [Agrobacterium larrymoorei]|uniref:Uncharacterized protein n=1 Tax=Agrobacterium larrymoorei TaxID=160699 RepID=A0AAJ2BDC7_9HYPH|nr:hypothetical protein [Agrobacterium larrymoorei]MDR6101763.1 hypothetical protein [Agrobacterium larrymoorei]
MASDKLSTYKQKRDFQKTQEPSRSEKSFGVGASAIGVEDGRQGLTAVN